VEARGSSWRRLGVRRIIQFSGLGKIIEGKNQHGNFSEVKTGGGTLGFNFFKLIYIVSLWLRIQLRGKKF